MAAAAAAAVARPPLAEVMAEAAADLEMGLWLLAVVTDATQRDRL